MIILNDDYSIACNQLFVNATLPDLELQVTPPTSTTTTLDVSALDTAK